MGQTVGGVSTAKAVTHILEIPLSYDLAHSVINKITGRERVTH